MWLKTDRKWKWKEPGLANWPYDDCDKRKMGNIDIWVTFKIIDFSIPIPPIIFAAYSPLVFSEMITSWDIDISYLISYPLESMFFLAYYIIFVSHCLFIYFLFYIINSPNSVVFDICLVRCPCLLDNRSGE